ncbi:MAG: heparinase, partial [Paenibacillus sp.]|nr:heparinase [Paenibacillus sp.]
MTVTDYLYYAPGQRKEWGSRFREMFPEAAGKAIEEAKLWCADNVIRWKGLAIDMGSPIDWLHNPTGDKEFTWGINRFKHLRSLGIAYACTGGEKYAAKAWEHVAGWIATQPCPWGLAGEEATYFQRPGPWRLLETGLRLRQWVYAYHFFRDSESWSGSSEVLFLESVKEHARFLSAYPASIEINHSIMHMIGLLSAGLSFPSWEESGAWTRFAVERLEACMREQVLPDGVHAELTPHYHMVSLELFVDCAVMLRKRGLSFSDEYERVLEGMAEFSRRMARQDGSMAPFADSYANQPPDLNAAALYYDRPEWLLPDQLHEQFWTVGPEAIGRLSAKAGGSSGEARERPGDERPGSESAGEAAAAMEEGSPGLPFAFPVAGYYGLGNAEQQMIFDAAALGGPHGHADALSFELCAFGEALLVDPGTYTYVENPWRRYFKSTAAHNTVLVDGQDQTPYLRTQRWGTPEAKASLLGWDAERQSICAEHDGYLGLGIMHRRAVWFLAESGEWVIIDRLTGSGEHVYQHRLHSRLLQWSAVKRGGGSSANRGGAETETSCFALRGNGLAGRPDSGLACDMLLFGPSSMEVDIEDGWESVRPLEMEPLKVVQALLTLDGGGWFATVVRPRLAAVLGTVDGEPMPDLLLPGM